MASSITLAAGATAPSLTDTIQINGTPVDLTGSTVRFQMRLITGAVLAVDSSATIVNAATGQVKYDWNVSDTSAEGVYIAWWKVTFGTGRVEQSPDFRVTIDASTTPGTAAQTGEVAQQAKALMPVTWNALSGDPRYGDPILVSRINYVKYRLFATIVSPLAEATVYNPLVLDYMAKEVALQIIPAGIDYWMSQHTSVQTDGSRESVTYPDRVQSLQKLQEWLMNEVRCLRPEFEGQFVVRRKVGYPKVSNNDQNVLTPNPHDWGTPADEGIPKNLPWGPAF